MAKAMAGDWCDTQRVSAWARQLGRELPMARPGQAIDHPARSLVRVFSHGIVGWAACAALTAGLLATVSTTGVLWGHGIAAPLIFIVVSWHYFSSQGAREPGEVAVEFTAIVVFFDLVVVGGWIEGSNAIFRSIVGTWLPFVLIFAASYLTGFLISTMPWPKKDKRASPKAPPEASVVPPAERMAGGQSPK